jgi:secretion/DNA translocation related TadE-like protein
VTPGVGGRERGAATVLVTAVLGLLVLVGGALGVVAALVVGHRGAQSAADLAALTGAVTMRRGGDACVAASEAAVANGAVMTQCEVLGSDVRVSVRVTGPRWLGQQGDLDAEARAGPARSPA